MGPGGIVDLGILLPAHNSQHESNNCKLKAYLLALSDSGDAFILPHAHLKHPDVGGFLPGDLGMDPEGPTMLTPEPVEVLLGA